MSKQNSVTADDLRKKGASCLDQIVVFEREWPKGTMLTKHAILRAIHLELDIEWYAKNFLPAPAWKVYYEAMTHAWDICEENGTKAQALEAYREAKAQALADICRGTD